MRHSPKDEPSNCSLMESNDEIRGNIQDEGGLT